MGTSVQRVCNYSELDLLDRVEVHVVERLLNIHKLPEQL
jgi:hypothetical protein